MDHSPPVQSRRGVKSGRVRRKATKERDAAIVYAVVVEGRSMRSVAREHGLSIGGIIYIIRRDADLFEPENVKGLRNDTIRGLDGAGMKQAWIAAEVGLNQSQVSRILSDEKGESEGRKRGAKVEAKLYAFDR